MSSYRSSAYYCTVANPDSEIIDQARKRARIRNAEQKLKEVAGAVKAQKYFDKYYVTRYRVVVRPRLGKNNPHAHLYRVGGSLHRSSSQTIRKEHGTRFDVYIQECSVPRKCNPNL